MVALGCSRDEARVYQRAPPWSLAAVAQILCLVGNDRDAGKGVGYNNDVSIQ
jgi:hypothetical protein